MRCVECGFNNPDTHTYCGNCGQRLVAPALSRSLAHAREQEFIESEPEPRRAEPEPRETTSLGGPSFLGLSGGENSSYEYLLEDEAPSYRGVWITLLFLAILAIVAAAYWEPLRNFAIATATRYTRTPAPPPSQTPPAPAAAQTAPASEPAATADTEAGKQNPAGPSQSNPGQEPGLPQNDQHNDSRPTAENKSLAPSAEHAKAKDEARASANEDTEAADEDAGAEPASRGRLARNRETDQLLASGEKYLYGRGVPRNCNQALSFLRAAAEQEDPRALSRLGALYSVGECVPQDRVMAYAWFSRAREADPRNPSLERNLNILWRDMSPDERRRVLGTNR